LLDQVKRNYLVSESKKITLAFSGNTFVDPADALCPSSICKSFFEGKWTYSDQKHLSPTGSKMLAPLYIEAIKEVLEQK
ncbi:MAG: SGNH hydrolase domain-containing protein, partial [Acidimicrobiaceae bacterium]